MRTTSLSKKGLKVLAVSALALAVISCKKSVVPEETATFTQSEEIRETGVGSGVYVSAADTAAAVKNLHLYSFLSFREVVPAEYNSNAKDGNGILYNKLTDEVYQLSRKNKTLYVFSNASNLTDPPVPSRTITDNTLSSGREITYDFKKDILYVANNTDSTIRVYRDFSMLSGEVTGEVLKINGQPWGIFYEEKSDRLIVVIDLAAMRLDIFDKPASLMPGMVTASRSLHITDRPNGSFSRLHGVTYFAKGDILAVTEIGEAAAPPVPTEGKPAFNADGGIYLFTNASQKLAMGGSFAADALIYGANTGMGNPVDIDYRNVHFKPYVTVAEKANKKILTFRMTDHGNATPVNTIVTGYAPEAIDLN